MAVDVKYARVDSPARFASTFIRLPRWPIRMPNLKLRLDGLPGKRTSSLDLIPTADQRVITP